MAGCVTFGAQPASAEITVNPVLDNLHSSNVKIPQTDSVYPASEYTLTEVTPEDVNNLPLNVIKYYDSNNLDKSVHYLQIGFKNPVYGEGDSVKYFKWSKDGDSVKLVETTSASDAVLTIKYNSSTADKVYAQKDAQIASVNEIYVGKDIKGLIGSDGRIESVTSDFIGNTLQITSSDDYNSSAIYTEADGQIGTVASSFIGNNITVDSNGGLVHATLIKSLGSVDNVNSEFVGNTVTSNANIFGGLVEAQSSGTIGNITSDFIRNTVTTTNTSIRGSIVRNDGKMNITDSKFVENTGISTDGKVYGGAIENSGTTNGKGLTVTNTVFTGNKVVGATSDVYGGAIANSGTLQIENSVFKDNYAHSTSGTAKGGAIYTSSDFTISANNGKTTEFTDNYTLNGATKTNEAIYVDSDLATLTLNATDNGRILLNDIINGQSGYNVLLTGDSTGRISLYNSILNADVTAQNVNIDMADSAFKTYDFLTLKSNDSAKFTIDIDFQNNNSDKFTLGTGSSGVIYLNDLNLIGGAPTTSQIIQILTGPDTISIGVSEDLLNSYHKISERDYGVSENLTSSAKWGTTFGAHLYKDTIEEGLRTAISGTDRTTADSLEYYVNTTTEDLGVVSSGDTMMLMNQSDKFAEKTFSANSSDDTYTLSANLGQTSGTFNVNGYNSSSRNVVDAAGHTMYEIGNGARANLQYLTINNLANSDGSLMKISEGGSGTLHSVNINGNENTASIVNDGNLTLSGGTSSAHNTITGGGIKGSGTTTININSYWDISASGLQNTVNNGFLYLNSGTLEGLISGSSTTYINDNQTVTTNADNLRTTVHGVNDNCRTSGVVLNLTGGEINSRIYSVTMNINGDVTVGENGLIGNNYSSFYTDINISEGGSLTADASKFEPYSSNYTKFTNEGTLNLTGGTYSSNNGYIYGSGTTNILGDVTLSAAVYNNIYVKDGTLSIGANYIQNGIVNDSILKLTRGTIVQNILPEINGTGKTQIAGNVYAYYTNFNQDVEILSNKTLYTNWNRTFTNIKNDGTLYISNSATTDGTSSSSHGVWSQYVSGDGTIMFSGYSSSKQLYLDNEAQLGKTTIESYARVWSNADLLDSYVTIQGNSSALTLTGGTINHQIKGNSNSASLYIDTDANVISNALITSTKASPFLFLNSNSTLTISADNLDAYTELNSGSNLKLTSGTWDNSVSGTGTVRILSGEEVQHDTTGGSGKIISAKVNIENNAKFTASATNMIGSVTNNGSLYLSGILNRKYSGTGTTYIDDTLHVSSGAGFPATFDLNNGHLISDGIATYTFGHTTGSGGITFNVNPSSDAHDLFNLASTSNAVFDIKDVIFGTYKTPSFANTVKTYQILKGSPSYLTLAETLQKDIHIYDNVRDQLGVNIYQDNPENRYFDDEYLDRIKEGDVSARIELATTENNHDSVKITYGDYVDASHSDRIDLLSDWNKYYTSKEKNFNFRSADDVYTSLADVGATKGTTLNINGVSTTTTDADGNTIINRSTIDFAGHSGFDITDSSRLTINLYNTAFINANKTSGTSYGAIAVYHTTFGTLLEDGTIQGGIVNCLFKNNSTTGSGYSGALHLGSNGLGSSFVHQILNSTFSNNSSDMGSGAIDNNGTISSISSSTFENNISTYSNGGAIANGGMNNSNNVYIASINNCLFKENTAICGGAIYNTKGQYNYRYGIGSISNSIFSGNFNTKDSSYSSYGGAIYNNSTINTISGTTFENNSTIGNGGAIYNTGTISEILNSTFEGNSSSYSSSSGGAIYNSGTINEILNNTFEGNSSSSGGGAIYNTGTISNITGSTFEGNTATSLGGAIYNTGTINEILNSTFIGNTSSSSYSNNAIYNQNGTITISARDIENDDGTLTKGLTEFTSNDANTSCAIYNTNTTAGSKTTITTLKAENNGVILINDKIINTTAGGTKNITPKLNLTGDSTGTIKLFNTVSGGDITADSVNINTANSKIQNYTFTNFTSEDSAKWTIDVDFSNKTADKFRVGDGTGVMYIDNLNVLENANKYTQVKVLDKSKDSVTVGDVETPTTQLALKDAVVDIRDTLGDTVYNNETYHQEAGYAVSSSKTWDRGYTNDMISQCIDEDLDQLSLIVSSGKHEVRNFVFRDGSTYTVKGNLGSFYKGTLNIKGVEGSTSTIDANGYNLFYLGNADHILNLSDVKLTGTDTLVAGFVNISGKETILDGKVRGTTTLNSGNLRFNTDTFSNSSPTLILNGGTLALDNDTVENYRMYNLTSNADTTNNLTLDLNLAAKTADKITVGSSGTGTITVSDVNYLNELQNHNDFVVQVIKNSSSSTIQLALDDSIKHHVFEEYTKIVDDEVTEDTNFNDTFNKWSQHGTLFGDLYLTTTSKTNDSIGIKFDTQWDGDKTFVENLGDTFDMVNSSTLSVRNFNSTNAGDKYNLSVDLGKTAAGTLNINGTLDSDGNRSTINFKNHDALQLGEDTTISVNNTRLTGARDIMTVDSESTKVILNNAYINGNIIGNKKFQMLLDGLDTTTIVGSITNSDVTFKNGGLILGENTFADSNTILTVQDYATVYLNDGDVSNYNINNINSSILSKYGIDIDLKDRTADTVTAEGSGRIVLEKFDILNNLANVTINDNYTIQILKTSNDSLQLEISETIKSQLKDPYKLGTVREIVSTDEINPTSQWTDLYYQNEADYDIYGKLKLATKETTNDSLHLYELRKHLADSRRVLGDTLQLLSTLETDSDRVFVTNEVATYTLGADIGNVTGGKLSLQGVSEGNEHSVIDMNAHKGFHLSNETEMSVSDVTFENAGYKDGSLIRLSNENAVLNLNNVTITDTASTNAIENDGTVNMTGGKVLLYSGITGEGVTNVEGADVTLTEGLSLTQDQVNVNSGKLVLSDDSTIVGTLTVGESGTAKMATSGITSAAENNGSLIFTGGELVQNVTGSGTTKIAGVVVNNAEIAQNVDVQSGEFTTSAANIGGVINNNAITNLTGTLTNVVTGNGTTNVNETLTLAQGAGIQGTLNLNNGIISATDSKTTDYSIGTMLNYGTFDIDVDLGAKSADKFIVGNTSNGTVYIDSINYLNEIKENETFKIQVLETNGTDAIQLALNEELTNDRINMGSVSAERDDLRATVFFDEKYSDYVKTGIIYGNLQLATTKTSNDSIEIAYRETVWGDEIGTARLDTLKELNQYTLKPTEAEKNFKFRTSSDVYTVAEDLGVTTAGKFNILGVSDTTTDAEGNTVVNRSVIDMNGHTGFDMSSSSIKNVMNIENVEFRNGKDYYIKAAGDTFGTLLEDGTVQGGIVNAAFKDMTGSNAALYFGSGSIVHQIKDSVFENNSSTSSSGGAIYNNGTISSILDSTFTGNSSSYGGAIYNNGTISSILNSTFDGNSAKSSRGAIYNRITIETISGSIFENNIASYGSAIYNYGTISNITGSTFEGNSSSYGAIYNGSTISEILNSTFTGNSSGGAIYNQGRISEILNSTFDGNSSYSPGGAIYNRDTISEILNSTFTGNSSSDSSSYGGAIYNYGTITISARDIENEDGTITKGLTEFTGNFEGSKLTDTNNYAIYNYTSSSSKLATMTLKAENNGVILMNDKIKNSRYNSSCSLPQLILTGDATGTIKLFDTVEGGDVSANSVNINTGNSKVQAYSFDKFTTVDSAKWTIDVDFATKTADTFTVGSESTGVMYLDNLKFLNDTTPGSVMKIQILKGTKTDAIQLALNEKYTGTEYELGPAARNVNETVLANTDFDKIYHVLEESGTNYGSLRLGTTDTTNDSIELKVDRTDWSGEFTEAGVLGDTLNLVANLETDETRNFNYKTSTDEYVASENISMKDSGSELNINGVTDGENRSTLNLNKHGFDAGEDNTLNIKDVTVTNTTGIEAGNNTTINVSNVELNADIAGAESSKLNINGAGATLNGIADIDTELLEGTLKFNGNTFENSSLTVTGGRVDLEDNKTDNYDINKLTSSENGKYSIDVDLSSQTSDKFNLVDDTSSGIVYIDEINYINGELPTEFTTQVIETNGNNDIQIKLSDEIKNKIYDFGKTEKNWDDLKADVDFDELFHDYHQEGEIKGSIKEATTKTTNDSIELKMDAPIWGEVQTAERKDTLHEISNYETESDKTFNFKTGNDLYESKTDVGKVNGTLTVNGVSDGEEKSVIDLNNHNGFELTSDTVLNLNDVTIGNAANDNLIIAKQPDSVVNITNNTLNGNIKGNDTEINVTGDDTDITTINGQITGSDTTLNGGTLKFNTDTFKDGEDSLTVSDGRINVQDSKVDTYDINKLTSSEDGKYSIDIDLTAQTSDKFNLKDATSSGVIYIDDINYINGELPTEFIAQILETNGNSNIQIKLSDEIKSKIYDLGFRQEKWDDMKSDVDFDEIIHDYYHEGEVKGSIKEATIKTTNDSIELKYDSPNWGETEITDRLDTLHEIAKYESKTGKTFNFKTSNDVYESKSDVGSVNGKLSINGVKDNEKMSLIDLKEFKGFELVKDSKLNVNNTLLSNGAANTLITATDESAEVTLNNSAVNGLITGVNGYKVTLTGDKSYTFDVNHEIQNANINLDTIRLDFYNPKAFVSSDMYINSGTLNLTADRSIADLSAKSVTVNNNFNMLVDADLQNQIMDKLPENTIARNGASINVAGINLISDTESTTVAIPFAYSGFKDNVKYTGNPVLSKETQITTAYAPIYKYEINYDNRDDMGYFVFARAGIGGRNTSENYNPAVLASPVATQAVGQSAMNETFRYVFEHADAFTQLPAIDRLSEIKANQYAISTDFNHNLGSLCTEHNNKAGWFRPYSTFETINLSNGPKVNTINYGSLVGYDSDFRHMKHGWHNVGTGYIGYNGSQMNYNGVNTTMNGGLLGLTETFYKGNFWTALTATAGAGVSESRTMYGKEDSTTIMGGIGSKTGYNIEFKEGKYILQPIMFMSYTMVKTLDYTNAAGVRLNNSPMHTIQLNPSVRFISNLKGGWQPYASVGMVWNLMNEAHSTANGIKLPEMHTKPYIEYGLGLQRNVKDRFTVFGQAMVRNGGRNGIALTAGLRWSLGHEGHPIEKVQKVNNKTVSQLDNKLKVDQKITLQRKGLPAVSESQPRKILKQLDSAKKTTLTKGNTTRTTYRAVLKQL